MTVANRRIAVYPGTFDPITNGHRDIIRRFGRFPHRNPILGRESTPEELAYIEAGGFAG